MAVVAKHYMDESNLFLYDSLIKNYISDEDASAYKKILLSADGKQIRFYKDEDATVSDTPDFIVYRPYLQNNTLFFN